MKDKIHKPDKPKREDLITLYTVINQLIKDDDCYYSKNDERIKGKVKV